MSDSDDAYERARAAIARAKAEGAVVFELDAGEGFAALDRLPPELGDLDGVRGLSLTDTQVTDLAPLAGLTGLGTITLERTQVADLAPLAGLTALNYLWLNDTQVADLTPLAGLTALESLWLNGTHVADLSPLAGLTGLQRLDLDGTQVADLTPLAGLTALRLLELDTTPAADLRPLRGLTRLAEDPSLLGGLSFKNCAAAQADPRIAEIAEIEDNAERAQTLFEYLRDWEPPARP